MTTDQEQQKWLAEAGASVKRNAFYMKKALVSSHDWGCCLRSDCGLRTREHLACGGHVPGSLDSSP